MTRRPLSTLILSVITLALVLLALTSVFISDRVIIWKLSILATEYGHWFALVSFAILSLLIVKWPKGWVPKIQIGLLFMCIFLFSRPFVQASVKEQHWASDLQKTFGAPVSPLVSFISLWNVLPESPVTMEKIVYSQHESESLTFDFYRAIGTGPLPWVLIVHGGGWDSGSTTQLTELNSHLARRGISVASVSYRFAPRWRWPAQREDIIAAATYIKAHAKDLGVDPNRWALLGRSAGGQIAEAVAYQKKDPSLKGIIAYYSPADLDFAYRYTKDQDIINSRELLINLLGGKPVDVPKAYFDSSPIQFVSAHSPPTLLIHGRPDSLTWYKQSERLCEQIKKADGRVVFIELPWAVHAFDFSLNGPGGQVATRAVDGFLTSVFR